MLRICLCLLIAFASASVAAREARLSSPGSSESCDEPTNPANKKPVRASTRSPAPPRETRVKQGVHGDTAPDRLQSPRWHSFLPGMFR